MLQAVCIAALAGSTMGVQPEVREMALGSQVHATSATPVTLGMDGTILSFGETISLHGAASEGLCQEYLPYFDSLGVGDTNGDGQSVDLVCGDLCGLGTPSSRYFFGNAGPAIQGYAVDFVASDFTGRQFDGFNIAITPTRCPDATSTTLSILISIYDDMDTSGTGFDADGDTVNETPFPPTDADDDGIPDAFLGGVIATFNNIPLTNSGYTLFSASGLADLGIDFPADGIGGFQVQVISEFVDTDGDTIPETPLPFELASPVLWAPNDAITGCNFPSPASIQSEGWWGLGYDVCNDEPGISPDPFTFVYQSYAGAVVCPDPLYPAAALFGTCPTGRLCADQNSDGVVTATDFTAWIDNYNNGDPRADVNQDASITPLDFTAWIAEFNLGPAGNICDP